MDGERRAALIADDDAYFRVAAGAILMRHFGFSDVIEASSLDGAIEYLSDNPKIDTALFDLSMPGMRTPTNLRAVRECFPNICVAVISASSARRDILTALEAGVHGYMLKSLPVADLVKALGRVFEGGIYVPPCLAELPATPAAELEIRSVEASTSEQPASASALTSRQRDVLDLLVQGKTNKEIAHALKLGEGTVKIHMAAIFRYFGVNNRAAAAVAGARPYPKSSRGVLTS
jgi:DNA-binding NarL/FixJ family response regulator